MICCKIKVFGWISKLNTKIEFFVQSTGHQNCLDKSLQPPENIPLHLHPSLMSLGGGVHTLQVISLSSSLLLQFMLILGLAGLAVTVGVPCFTFSLFQLFLLLLSFPILQVHVALKALTFHETGKVDCSYFKGC